MTQHILCAVDLTHMDDAQSILKEAAGLAEFYGAVLSVITVIPDYGATWVGSFFKQGTLQEAISQANTMLHKLVDDTLPGHAKIQHIVETGNVYEKVLEAVDKTNSDLVVVGAHKPDFADKVVGPNAARIVRHAKVSVLVLRG